MWNFRNMLIECLSQLKLSAVSIAMVDFCFRFGLNESLKINSMKKIISCLLLSCLYSVVYSTTYYVSPTGNNNYLGTESKPFLTFAYAASIANPGDVFIFEDGTYTVGAAGYFATLSRSGNSGAYITYKARNKGGAILDGLNNTTQFCISVTGSYINIEGFEIKNISDTALMVTGGATKINFRDLNVHDIGRRCTDIEIGLGASYFNSSSYITVERCLIHDIGRFGPGENGCSPTKTFYKEHDHGIYCDGCSNLTIQNNVFYNLNSGFSLQIYSGSGYTSSNISFINNTCHNGNHHHPAGHIIFWGNADNILIANNIFKEHDISAIQIFQGTYHYSNVLITKNITSGGNGTLNTGTAPGVKITGNYNSTDPLFTNEQAHDYSLQANSIAINNGFDTGITTDFTGNARSKTDIGAFEYIQPGALPNSGTPPVPH